MPQKIKRVLISIGCNQYTKISPLTGAENDAKKIFELLIDPKFGDYERSCSRLLSSPTLNDINEAFKSLSGLCIESLTIYFSGHGGVSAGSYYLCPSDADPGLLSLTGIGLPHLFSVINNLAPSQCNIIIDACQSGGVVQDLSILIKPELMGKSNSQSISILIASASNETAKEIHGSSVATNELLKVLDGTIVVQDQNAYLDLIEIGRIVSKNVDPKFFQSPAVWGLNLYGPSKFSVNPHFDHRKSLIKIETIPANSEASRIINDNYYELVSLYNEYRNEPGHNKSYFLMEKIYSEITAAGEKGNGIQFIIGYAETLVGALDTSAASFDHVIVYGNAIISLGKNALEDDVKNAVLYLSELLFVRIKAAVEELNDLLDRGVMLAGGLSDLFLLPIKFSKILGWGAMGTILQKDLHVKKDDNFDRAFTSLVRNIIKEYPGSLSVVSDEQAPYLALFFKAAHILSLADEAESIFSLGLHSLIEARGQITHAYADGRDGAKYILAKSTGSDFDPASLAKPPEVTILYFVASKIFGFEDILDPCLQSLDHHTFNMFIPRYHSMFYLSNIEEGKNHSFQIGGNVFVTDDFTKVWNDIVLNEIAPDATLQQPQVCIVSICASLIKPNRTPWFLFV